MRKRRSDSKLSGLTPAQLARLEQWLFEEKLGYEEARERAIKEFGFSGSKAGLRRFYKHRAQERLLEQLMDTGREAEAVGKARLDTGRLRSAGLKLLGQHFYEQAREAEGADLATMARLLLGSEANEIQRQQNDLKREQQALRRQRLDFQVKQWQYDVMEEAVGLIPELQKLRRLREETEDPYAANRHTNALRKRMFGSNIPELLPENEEEAQAMAEEQARADGERLRLEKECRAQAERQRVEEEERRAARRREESAMPPAEPIWEDQAS